MSCPDALRVLAGSGNLTRWTRRWWIYRAEVTTIMGALADIHVNVQRILDYIEGDEDGEEEEEVSPDP